MPVALQDQGGPIKARPSRPNLILDTHHPVHDIFEDTWAQSAPVGTRQEKGIAPLYQAGDRHCARLAEMMNTPTWRSQNFVQHMGYEHVQRLKTPSEESAQAFRYRTENAGRSIKTAGLPTEDTRIDRPIGDMLHLDRHSEEIQVLGIQPFPEISKPSNSAFFISAAVSREALRPYETFSRDTLEADDGWSDQGSSAHSQIPSADSPGEARNVRQEKAPKFGYHAPNLAERDDGIQSFKRSLRSPKGSHQVSSDEQQRFRDLLDRLHRRPHDDDCKGTTPFADPAIIAFGHKKADPGTPTKQRSRNRSDSGYASPSVYTRPNTRAESRSGRGNSVIAGLKGIGQQKDGSHDSVFDESPSKNSILNPAAKEFSVPSISLGSPTSKGLSIPPSFSNKAFMPSQQFEGTLGTLSPLQTGLAMQSSQGAWCPPQVNIVNPSAGLMPMHQGFMPGTTPQWSSMTGMGIESAAGMINTGLPCLPPPAPGLVQPPGLGLVGLTPPLGLGPSSILSPFHQQLSSMGQCCNPAHQAMAAFALPNLPGVAPPIVAPPTSGVSVPLAGLKHVPKPKVPNTAGQQDWELMHELRRMNEPGYAQKCKEKQKKRYMKQIEKTSDRN